MSDILKSIISRPCVVIFSLFIIYRPEYLIQFSSLDIFINILRVGVVLFLILTYLGSRAPSKAIIWNVIIFGGFNIWCVITGTWTFSILIEFILIICINILVELLIKNKIKILNQSIQCMLFIYAVLNTFTIVINAEVEKLFLGFDNDISMRVIPLIGVMFYTSVIANGRLRWVDYVIYSLFLLDFLLTWAATSLISMVIMGGFIFWDKIKLQCINSKTIMLGSIFVWISLFVFKIQSLLSSILVGVLNKDITFSYRMYIWDSVVTAIKQRPLGGFGNVLNSQPYYDITYEMYYASIAPHNFWLYICASTGIIGVILIMAYICWCYRNIDIYPKHKTSKILLGAFLAYMLCGIFSSYYGLEYLAFLLAIACNDKSIKRSSLKWMNKEGEKTWI